MNGTPVAAAARAQAELAVLVRDAEDADRREQERRRRARAEHLDREVALLVAGQHPRPDPPPLERLAVRAHRQLGARAAGDVAERARVDRLLGAALPLLRRDRPVGAADVDRVLDARAVEAHSATLTSSLPRFAPSSRPMKARGAFSIPSTTSSR